MCSCSFPADISGKGGYLPYRGDQIKEGFQLHYVVFLELEPPGTKSQATVATVAYICILISPLWVPQL